MANSRAHHRSSVIARSTQHLRLSIGCRLLDYRTTLSIDNWTIHLQSLILLLTNSWTSTHNIRLLDRLWDNLLLDRLWDNLLLDNRFTPDDHWFLPDRFLDNYRGSRESLLLRNYIGCPHIIINNRWSLLLDHRSSLNHPLYHLIRLLNR